MGEVLTLPLRFVNTGGCVSCGVPVVLEEMLYLKRKNDHEMFYCPNGHPQHYPGKSEIEKLKEQLAEKDRFIENSKKRREWAEQDARVAKRSAAAYKGKLNHVKTRVASGVCPCCKKSFKVLAKHMAAKHPDFKNEE